MNLNFKGNDYMKQTHIISDEHFAITDRHPFAPFYCEEYEIIQRIKENKYGFFDFSKALIDVGAEDGNYAMLLDFDKNYCFEPNKRMCCLIYTNMYLKDKVYNTEVYNVALGEKNNEKIIFNGFSEKGGGYYEETMNRCENGVQEMSKVTLDSFNIKNVGLIKTDTEGFDLQVLKGAMRTIIDNDYPPILFENWPVGVCGQTEESEKTIFNFLTSIGYVILKNWGDHETHLAIKKDSSQLENFLKELNKKKDAN
jgi:FkbM family methyltransferase